MSSTNPFQAPADAPDRDAGAPGQTTGDVAASPVLRDVALFSANQCAGATLLGGPLAGLGLVAWNQWSVGRRDRALSWAAGAVGFTLVLVVVGIVMPAGVPPMVVPLASVFAVRAAAAGLEQAGYGSDVRALPRSSWLAFGAGLVSMVLVLGTVLVLVVALAATGILGDGDL